MVLEYLFSCPQIYQEIKNPEKIIYTHCIFKGVQLGAFLGGVYSLGHWSYLSFYKKEKSTARYNKFMMLGLCAGLTLSNLMAYSRVSKSTLEQNQSRAWRIWRNSAQNLTDNFTLGGMVLGIPASQFLGSRLVGGALFGALGGLLVSIIFQASKKYT